MFHLKDIVKRHKEEIEKLNEIIEAKNEALDILTQNLVEKGDKNQEL